jgi:hypothetical protein
VQAHARLVVSSGEFPKRRCAGDEDGGVDPGVCPDGAGFTAVRGFGLRLVESLRRWADQADRAIRTGWLHTLLRFHLRPIDVVVFHGSSGETWF